MTIFALSRSTPALPLNTPHPRLPSPPSPGQTRRSSTTLSAASSGPASTLTHRRPPRRRRRRRPAIPARPPNHHPRTPLRRSSTGVIAPKIQHRGPSARPSSTHAKQRSRRPRCLGRRPRIACVLQIRQVAPCGSRPAPRHASCLSVRVQGQARVCQCNMI
jgi:hypothetical protein